MIRLCRAEATLFLVTAMNTVIPASAAEQGYDELLELFASFREMTGESDDDFELQVFMDEFFESGLLPIALIRWEMTGYADEVSRLW